MAEQIVFLNGGFLALSEAHISPSDRGFLLGGGLFETLRVKEGKVLFLEAHLQRLRRGANFLKMSCPLSRQRAQTIIENLVVRNRIAEGRLRITLTCGTSQLPGVSRCESPTLLVTLERYSEPSPAKYRRGCKIVISKFRVFSGDVLSCVKSIDRLRHLLAKEEAEKSGAFEALFLNEKNQVAECTTSNIFLTSGGKLLTPPRDAGILEGTVRNLVMRLARRNGITVKELPLPIERLFHAEEIFLTNSLFGVLPVCRVGDRGIGVKTHGPITETVSQLYQNALLRELRC
jgi:branched-chain amino acid aminotransferase